MNDEQFRELSAKIDKIIRLLAINLVKDIEVQNKQIQILSKFGFKPSEIAELLGTTSNTVRVSLSIARRKKE